ncbi:MAG: glycosyltransferase family 2 protein [Bacteroidales bacterium]|nr:glycosyltransferase family 2 protein [Bacteroidales bacterium]
MPQTVSIIVPCYQQAEFLSDALNSIVAQTYCNWECIIVNDGSTDNTPDVASNYCQKDARFKYVEQNNQGLATARNNGIKASIGEFILPLDADDLIDPTYIEKAINHFQDYPETSIVYCRAKLFGAVNQDWDLPKYDYESFIWQNCIFCSAIFKRSDYNKTIGYNPNMKYGFEDWDLWLSILSKDSTVYQIDEPLFFYRKKSQSMTTTTHEQMRNLYSIIYNNHKEIYEPYCNHLIEYKNASLLLEEEAHNAILKVKASKSYRLGYFILHPIYKLLSIFKRNSYE